MRNWGFLVFFLCVVAGFGFVLARAIKTSQVSSLSSDIRSLNKGDSKLSNNLENEPVREREKELDIDTRPTLKVALSIAPPRKIFKNGEFSGFDVGIMEDFADRLNMQVKFEKCSFKECLVWLREGRSDMTTAIEKNEDREKYLSFLNPKVSYNSFDSVYVLKDSKISIDEYGDLTKLKIGRLENGPYIKGAKSEKSITFVDFNNMSELFEALLTKKVNAITGSNYRTEYEIHERNLGDKIRKAAYQVRSSFLVHYFVLSKKSQYFPEHDRMEQVVASMQLSGAIDKLIGDFYEVFRLPVVGEGR